MSGSKNYGTFKQWNTTQQREKKKELCDSMDGTGEHYAKCRCDTCSAKTSEISQAVKDKYHMISPISGT